MSKKSRHFSNIFFTNSLLFYYWTGIYCSKYSVTFSIYSPYNLVSFCKACPEWGKVQINHNRFLGYTKDADGNLVIDPEQAETVKRIYREYLEGLSMDKIATGLERNGNASSNYVPLIG